MQSERQSIASTSSSSGSLLQVKSSDVVKRGCLYVKRPPSNNPVKLRLKTWQKRYLVLRDMWTQDGDTVLELYNNEIAANNSVDDDLLRKPNNNNNHSEHFSVSLRNVIYVDTYTESRSFPFAFLVLRSAKSPLIFGAKTDFEMREWMMAIKLLADKVVRSRPTHTLTVDGTLGRGPSDLKPPPPRVDGRSTLGLRKDDQMHRSTPQLLDSACTNSPNVRVKKNNRPSPTDPKKERTSLDLDSKFLVRVQRTEDSSLHHLEGEYYMFVSDTEICLRRTPQTTEETAISWPLQHIRKLKSEATTDDLGDLITLVASSHCGQSQGMYTFRITSGLDLIRRVRMFAKRMEAVDSCCKRQQMDMAKLKKAASSSLGKLLSSSGNVGQSMQSLVMSSGSSSESQLDQQIDDARISSTSSQSHMYCFTGNSYLPIVDDSGNLAPPGDTLAGKRVMTLSRSMGSLGFLSTTSRRIDSGFESSEEVVALTANPPVPPPRPVHTIGLS